ncbi:DUF3990 domain-containing protein [Parabacteroides goldsteinii]|uniref:DUF3990 domain-containing protein n=1 Tax=Parabacteroides goldsteinii TaxID=328812 RepID=UPI002730AA2B|nr:DUF3990 domain-containing protein [Parabacteroides goldsteinii]
MIVYHGSYCSVERPELTFSWEKLDFGKGFYITPIREQAERWSKRFLRARKAAILNVYELDENLLKSSGFKVKTFTAYDEEWLDFIFTCRKGETIYLQYDVIIGGVANDNVFATLDAYFSGYMSKDIALDRLKYEKPNHQICILNDAILEQYLVFKEAIDLI